ncbi:MAG: hypothetical protein R3240_05725 [Gammaproteobacteria bacterium]|nr:hypothetical protein [Gammaproteobacteria bacterium]
MREIEIEFGARGFIQKPFTLALLEQALNEYQKVSNTPFNV